jgi:hypothetical protein
MAGRGTRDSSDRAKRAPGRTKRDSSDYSPLRLQKLGEVDNTHAGSITAIRLWNRYQESRNEPTLQEMTMSYIESDNLRAHLTMFCAWLGKTTISIGWQNIKDLQSWVVPVTMDKTKFMKASSKVDYASRVKNAIKEKFPSHPDWHGHTGDDDSWWTVTKKGLDKAAQRNQNTNEDESTTGLRPLYLENCPGYQPRERGIARKKNTNSRVR